jgi:asparagine synthase (glutamine-hydrolysing)
VITAWCGSPRHRIALSNVVLESGARPSRDVKTDESGRETAIVAVGPAERTASGHSVGRAPLPYVSIERPRGGGLTVERGGFGGRPAYVRSGNDLVLASTNLAWVVDASRALGWPLTLDPEHAAASCILDAGPDGMRRTPFREIQELPPGARAEIVPGRMTLERLEPPRADELTGSRALESLCAQLSTAMDRAVEGADCVGVLTGGGVDSGALLAMARARVARTTAFAIAFESDGDDRPHLATLARALGIEPISVAPSDAELPPDLTVAGLPLTWPSGAIEGLALRRARVWGASRVLAGLGADELFDGEPEAASLLVPSLGLRAAVLVARNYEGMGLRRGAARAVWPWLRRTVPWAVRRIARKRARPRIPSWAGPTTRRVMAEAHERALDERPWIERTPDERIRAAFFDPHLARASGLRHQLECLSGTLRIDPYLDAELATFALALPPQDLLGAGERRGLFRQALSGILPESVRTRRDKASFAPVHRAMFRPPLRARLEPYARGFRLADLGVVEPGELRRIFGETAAHERVDPRLYSVLAVEAFLRAC